MKQLKSVTLLITIAMAIILGGCSTIQTKIVDPTGRQLPDPNYTLRVIGEPILVVFYYTSYEELKDVDGSAVGNPTYLDFLKFHDFHTNKVKAVTLTIEVNNPQRLEYSLYQKLDMKIGKGFKQEEVQKGGEANRSNLPYRQFVYKLPYGENVRTVDNLVTLYIGNSEVARIGNFRYNLIH